MTLKIPNLDDRTFEDLVAEAKAIIDRLCPQWTDRSPSDPGMTLVEVCAYLTEALIYRVNRFPAKAHLALLDLLGVAPLAPAAAEVTLTFSRATPADGTAALPAIIIPEGTEVSDKGGTTIFVTLASAELPARPAGAPGGVATAPPFAEIRAIHAEMVNGELLGHSCGEPGQFFTVRHGPILRRPTDPLAVIVGVEVADDDRTDHVQIKDFEGKPFAIW